MRGPVTWAAARPLEGPAVPAAGGRREITVYGDSLHRSVNGEWDFDLDLKPLAGFPVTVGWLNAVRRGHARLHRGLDVGVPSLVLRSDKTHYSKTYSDATDRADTVLDVRQIARWAGCLGNEVTSVPIADARHDVFLSLPRPRREAYGGSTPGCGSWRRPARGPGDGATERHPRESGARRSWRGGQCRWRGAPVRGSAATACPPGGGVEHPAQRAGDPVVGPVDPLAVQPVVLDEAQD